MLDPSGATKFLGILAGNNQIKVVYEAGLQVPYALPDGSIHVGVPKIGNLLDWNFNVHHEVSHAFPAHKYHFDAMGRCKKKYGELGGYVLNILVDNIAERYQYERYEGRRMILSKGRYESIVEKAEKLFPDVATMGIIHGLLAWDCRQRTSWMGYPFKQFLSPVDKYPEVVKHCDDIHLEHYMAEQANADHLVEIVGKVLEFSGEDSKEKKQGDDDEESSEGDPSGDPSDPSDGVGGDSSPSDQGGSAEGSEGEQEGEQVRNQRATTGGDTGIKVSAETKVIMAEFLMEPEEHVVNKMDKYVPEAGEMRWLDLEYKPNEYLKARIEQVAGNSKLTKSIQRHLQAISQKSNVYGQKAGKLANRSLYKTAYGGNTIFKQQSATKIERDTAICVLCDCSASMSSYAYGASEKKITMAMASIAIMADTLYSMRIPFEVLGFTDADKDPDAIRSERISVCAMIEFKSYAENLNRGKVIERLASVPNLRNNLDAEAVLEAAHRLMARPEKNKVLIVLSDGNPVGHFVLHKSYAHEYLKEVCEHIEKDSPVDLLAIGIADHNVSKFYKNYQVVNKVEELDKTLLTLLKDRLIK